MSERSAQALHVRFTLITPMRAPDAGIHLDALLAWSAVHASMPPVIARQEDLPLEKYTAADGRWVWKASRLIFRATHRQALTLTRRLDVDEIARDQGHAFEATKLNVLTPGTGPYKSYAFRAPLVQVDTAEAWCVGDRQAVKDALQSITHVGKLSRVDCGRIGSISITEDDEPQRERWRLRTMPESAPGYYATAATLRAPYWKRENRDHAWEPSAELLLRAELADSSVSTC